MFGKMSRTGLILCVMVLSFGVQATAQEAISSARRELIKELLVLTGGQKMTEAFLDSMLLQQERDMSALLSQMIDTNMSLTTAERTAMRERLNVRVASANKRFRELFKQKVNFAQLMDDISYSLYGKYFTESELSDLVAFYKSPTGKKTIEVMPQLFAESMAKTSDALLPKVREIIGEVMNEEMKLWEKEQPPARTKKRRRS